MAFRRRDSLGLGENRPDSTLKPERHRKSQHLFAKGILGEFVRKSREAWMGGRYSFFKILRIQPREN
jgi:hypothetical protein